MYWNYLYNKSSSRRFRSSVHRRGQTMPKALARPVVGLKGQIALVVYGLPVPQGSKKTFFIKKLNRAVITEDNKRVRPWRQEVSGAAIDAMTQRGHIFPIVQDIPLEVWCTFYFPRPKSLKKAITEKTTKPDIDKLLRAVFDALTGTVFEDDAQVVRIVSDKHFSQQPRVEIYVKQYFPPLPLMGGQ
jgi:crossover junction endodeoxyribonuclease RusA